MNSSSILLSSLRRSSSRFYALHRPICNRLIPCYSTSATAGAGESAWDRDIGQFFKAVVGIVASGSALGVWFLSSSFSSSSSSATPRLDSLGSGSASVVVDDDGDGTEEFSLDEKKTRYLFGDAYRKRVFFNYEKRIRLRSPPEKVFEYFASHRTQGSVFMTPADLMRAVVPVFPPSDSNTIREGYLRGERRPGDLYCPPSPFFMLFDTNNDGLISFQEYIFFVTLLSIPESSFSVAFKMFDLDSNGEIEREEFKKVMALMQSYNRQGACHRDGRSTGHKIGNSVENFGVVEYFFGKDGSESLQLERFVEFLKNLHDEIVRLEFAHYDFKSTGTISAKDFALSMVASADIKQINKFLERVDELDTRPHLRDMRISLEEFQTFAELRRKLKPLALAIFSHGKVNGILLKSDFQRATYHVCGTTLSDSVVDLVFYVFDTNNDGSLSSEEFLNALQRRETDVRGSINHNSFGVGFRLRETSSNKILSWQKSRDCYEFVVATKSTIKTEAGRSFIL